MSDRPLPRPVANADFYLKALLDEIRALRDDLKAPQVEAAPDGMIELREPLVVESLPLAQPEPTPLPDDFPGKAALGAAGIEYLEDVPRKGKDLTAISGIGAVTANQILTWFKVNS